ncbi:MAG: class I SAM-dependent methyltransferase [Methylococcaceae bacterium]
MKRTPEPDLMDDECQAESYALADFAEPHNHFVAVFADAFPDFSGEGVTLLDLGCGTADVTLRFARHYPGCSIDGVDGASAMLAWGQRAIEQAGLASRIRLIQTRLPHPLPTSVRYGGVLSNSLLHHLEQPLDLWRCIGEYTQAGAPVMVMDLLRPDSEAAASALVERYAGTEAERLRQDFFNSLRAAYTIAEVQEQLACTGLNTLMIRPASDRHFVVTGRVRG